MLSVLPLLATLEVAGNASPASAVPAAPLPTYSYYLGTVNQQTLYNLGYSFGEDTAAGQLPQHALLILDWGTPDYSGGYGTILPGGCGCFESLAAELAATEEFGWGFYYGTGVLDETAQAFIAMGMANAGAWFNNTTNADNFGIEWAETTTAEQNYFVSEGIATQAQGRGAIDAEMDWDGPSPTLSWATGYSSDWTVRYWDFGDAAGCYPGPNCDGGYTEADVVSLAYGEPPAYPFPEIADQGNATNWGSVAAYAADDEGILMNFEGPVSEYQACIDLGQPPQCSGANENPTASYDQLWNALNCSGCPDPGTPGSSTDIRWHLVA